MGFAAYGFQHMLSRIQSGELQKIVPESKGVAVLHYTGWQIRRALVTKYVMNYGDWYSSPYFKYSDSELKGNGGDLFENAFIRFSYKFFNGTLIGNYFDIPIISDRLVNHVAQMILESRKIYLEQFPGSRFYIMFYPVAYNNHPETRATDERMKAILLSFGVDVLDYRNLLKMDEKNILSDGHPSFNANSLVADELKKDLGLK